MGYSYSDLRKVEKKIKELNGLCTQCQNLSKELQSDISQTEDALKSVNALINEGGMWVGADADSCADAVDRLRESFGQSREQFAAGMDALHSALMDEILRQQTKLKHIYDSLWTIEVGMGMMEDAIKDFFR